jgi:hypothetical protein
MLAALGVLHTMPPNSGQLHMILLCVREQWNVAAGVQGGCKYACSS